jgi:hypothetical protein
MSFAAALTDFNRTDQMLKKFPPDRNYMLLRLADLLDARDHYHVHLSHLSNVVGTAVGRYLIHEKDWYAKHSPDTERETPKPTGAKTLFNTVVRDWSWPCVLVFVNTWEQKSAFKKNPDLMVPRALYLPDGRVVPTCTVLIEEDFMQHVAGDYHLSFPNSYVGGGYVTFSDVQGQQHMGSIACLVTDGDLTYALTNRHVTGAEGREMFTMLGGKRVRIGVSDRRQIATQPFPKMYDGWAGTKTELRVDAGLIRIEDIADWTTQVCSMGPMDDWMDLTTDTLTLDFIGENVRAFGAASGELLGTVGAMFYRYASSGGTDFVTDFLIFPRRESRSATLHGDSGTLWFWEEPITDSEGRQVRIRRRPFAVQWGGQNWISQGEYERTGRFAMATSLSLVCRELGVTLLRDWNSGLPEYWAAVGHYTIGYFACEDLSAKLGKLMKANQELVSYPTSSITSRSLITKPGPGGIVPLADVPDRLWAHGKMIRGSADKPNHFADMDKPDPQNGNKTLLQLCQDPTNINPDFWLEYYDHVGDKERGLLPFRVWQFFDEMVDAAKKKDASRFVCAAGVCAHYVGDACQPLHISYMFNGEPNANGKGKRGDGVHSAYEDEMLRKNSVELLQRLQKQLANGTVIVKPPQSGKEAAIRTVDLMRRTFGVIKPKAIVDAYAEGKDLWPLFGLDTVKVIADGVVTMRAIWKGAWKSGSGDNIPEIKLVQVEPAALKKLYMKKTWMPSKSLRTVGQILTE